MKVGHLQRRLAILTIFDNAEQLVSSIEVKDKDFTKEDVEHAIAKICTSSDRKKPFLYLASMLTLNSMKYMKRQLYSGKKGYFLFSSINP